MEMSGSSSSVRSRARVAGGSTRSSPIPYREGPLEYSPPVMCKCGTKAARWISWTDENPGRRFLKYFHGRSSFGGCDFWLWVDPMPSPYMQELLLDMRDAVRELKREKKELMTLVSEGAGQDASTFMQAHLYSMVCKKEEESSELRSRIGKLEKRLKLFKFISAFVVLVACMGWMKG